MKATHAEANQSIGQAKIIDKRAQALLIGGRDNRLSVQLQQQPMTALDYKLLVAARQPPKAGQQAGGARGLECPPEWCQCTWKGGKQFADCSPRALNSSLSPGANFSIPSGLDPLLQVLNISGNLMEELPAEAFNSLHLNNLQRVYMSG